jgi:hypothetical protein
LHGANLGIFQEIDSLGKRVVPGFLPDRKDSTAASPTPAGDTGADHGALTVVRVVTP